MNNTHPNPTLQYIDKRGIVCYKPAYQLEDSDKERDGRNKWQCVTECSVVFHNR